MRLITEPLAVGPPAALAGKERDTLPLTWEERRWTRRRAETAAGRKVALALPTGSVLRDGDVLAIEEDWYLVVEAQPEPVIAAMPRDRAEAIRLAFDIGNRHVALAIDGAALLVPDGVAMEQLLARAGVPWERRQAVFDPIRSGQAHDPGPSPTHGHRHGSHHVHGRPG